MIPVCITSGRWQALSNDWRPLISSLPIVLDEGEAGPLFVEKRGYPALATAEQGRKILERMAQMSEPFGTQMNRQNDGASIEMVKV